MAVGKMSKLMLVTLAILCLTAVLVSADDDSWWSMIKSQAKKISEKANIGFEDMGKDAKSGLKVAGENLYEFGKTVLTKVQKGYEEAKEKWAGSYFGYGSEAITEPKKKVKKTKAQKETEDVFDESEP